MASKYPRGDEEAVTVSFGLFGTVENVFGAIVSTGLVESGIIKDYVQHTQSRLAQKHYFGMSETTCSIHS